MFLLHKVTLSNREKSPILTLYFLLTFLFKIISSNNIIDDFHYVKTLELVNGDILMSTEKGVFLKESTSGEIEEIDEALLSRELSKEEFEFTIITQFERGEKIIIVVYKFIVYIFTSEGGFLSKADITIDTSGTYYTLVPYRFLESGTSKDYYFLIGYLSTSGSSKFQLSLFRYNINSNIHFEGYKYLFFKDVDNVYGNIFGGFNCQIMNSTNYNDILTCFTNIANVFVVSSFDLDDFILLDNLASKSNTSYNPIFINTVLSKDKTKALACYLDDWNFCQCEIYDINSNSLILHQRNEELRTLVCKHGYFSTTIMYNSERKDEYYFGCFGYMKDLVLVKFNSNFEIVSMIRNQQYIYNDQDCSTLSIISSLSDEEYEVLTGCENIGVLFKNDLPEGFMPHSKTKTFDIQVTSSFSESQMKSDTNYYLLSTINKEKYGKTSYMTDYSTQILEEHSNELINRMAEKFIYSTIINQDSVSEAIYNKDKTYLEQNETCPEVFLYQNIETKECLNYCSSEYLKNKKCKINKVTNSNINDLTENIRNIMNNENMTSDTNIIIEGGNTIYQLISNQKMSDNDNTNMSIIDLGDCEQKLLDEYHLDYLLILKIDTKINENTAVIFNYEVYNPYTKEKLNMSLCHDMKIKTYSSYYPSEESLTKIKQLSESGYDLYDINSEFYQDICASFTTENGTDILLSDRKNDFYENVSLCENDCDYKGYDLEKKRVQCECPVKEELIVEEGENKNILENFFDGSNFSNIKLLKCFKLVFSAKGQKNNKGSIIFLCLIFSLIILGLIFAINQDKFIIRNITKINNEKYNKNNINNINSAINNYNPNKFISFPPKKQKNKNALIVSYNNNNHNNMTNSIVALKNKNNSNFKTKEKNKNVIITEKNIIPEIETIKYDKYNFTNEELNDLSYELALTYDKRNYWQYYISLLKEKHLIIFTFCNSQDYNIFTLKFSLFISSFALYFAVNALFFNDETMHEIYEQNGNAGIISQISNIFYSTIISCFINVVIKKLGLSNSDMVIIKKIPNPNEALKQSVFLKRKLKIKFTLFFTITFILVSFFWYFISAFCAVYKNTQKILIENTISSFGLSFLYPLGLNIIPGIFRIPSLKNYSECSKCCFFISKIIALI